MLDMYMKQFERPYLLALVPIAAGLLGLSAIAEVTGSSKAAGFLVLYSVVALIICSIGYTTLLTLKYSTQMLQQWRIQHSKTE